MPNWCSNNLAVYGDEADVKKFIEDNKGGMIGDGENGYADGEIVEYPLSFAAQYPCPFDQEQFEGKPHTETLSNPEYWYNWNVACWGTKWDLGDDTEMDERADVGHKHYAYYTFDTAWSPPVEWLEHIASNYPTLSMKLEYREDGMGFAGVLGFHKGDEVENQYWKQHFHTDVDTYDDVYG